MLMISSSVDEEEENKTIIYLSHRRHSIVVDVGSSNVVWAPTNTCALLDVAVAIARNEKKKKAWIGVRPPR